MEVRNATCRLCAPAQPLPECSDAPGSISTSQGPVERFRLRPGQAPRSTLALYHCNLAFSASSFSTSIARRGGRGHEPRGVDSGCERAVGWFWSGSYWRCGIYKRCACRPTATARSEQHARHPRSSCSTVRAASCPGGSTNTHVVVEMQTVPAGGTIRLQPPRSSDLLFLRDSAKTTRLHHNLQQGRKTWATQRLWYNLY